MKLKLFKKREKVLPKFKHLVPEAPGFMDFERAWRTIFGYVFSDCKVTSTHHDEQNTGFLVKTPDGEGCMHSGFGYHTETPNLKEGQSVFYDGCGCPWDTDADGVRFYLILKGNKTIHDLDEAIAVETIRLYITQQNFRN